MISRVRQNEKLCSLMEADHYRTAALLGTQGRRKLLLKDDTVLFEVYRDSIIPIVV